MCRGHEIPCRWNQKAVSNMICGARWGRSCMYILFLATHNEHRKTYILFVVDDPAAGYWYVDAKTENMYINMNMLMWLFIQFFFVIFTCIHIHIHYSYSCALLYSYPRLQLFSFGQWWFSRWMKLIWQKQHQQQKQIENLSAEKKNTYTLQCRYKCWHPIIQNPYEANNFQCFNGRLWNV